MVGKWALSLEMVNFSSVTVCGDESLRGLKGILNWFILGVFFCSYEEF